MEYRTISRVISIFVLIFTILGTLRELFGIVLFVTEATPDSEKKENETALNETKTAFNDTAAVDYAGLTALQWATYTLELICYILLIYAAWRLFKGTAQSVSSVDGLRHCRIWRGITIFFTVVMFIDIVFKFVIGDHWLNSAFALFCCIFQIVALIFVQKYMKELTSSLLTSTGGSNPGAQCYYPNVK